MSKKIIIVLLLILSVIAAIYMFSQNDGRDPLLTLPETEVPSASPDENENENAETITAIYENAQKGMIPEISLISGESVRGEVLALYGEPASSDETDNGHYETYPEESLNVGYRGSTVFDLRRD